MKQKFLIITKRRTLYDDDYDGGDEALEVEVRRNRKLGADFNIIVIIINHTAIV